MSDAKNETLWTGEPLLPPVGALVLIAHGRDDDDHICRVTGYEAKPSLDRSTTHRVFLNLRYEGTTTTNQRLLCDVRPLTKAKSIAKA